MIDQEKIDEQMLDHYEKLADEAEEVGHTRSEEAARWVIDVYQENQDLKGVIHDKDKEIDDLQWQIDQYQRQEAYGR